MESFAAIGPSADGLLNDFGTDNDRRPEGMRVDRAQLLTLSAPESTALMGGLRLLGANAGQSKHGVFTDKPGTLSNDFFANLLNMRTEWQPAAEGDVFEGRDRASGAVKWTGTGGDLVFGSNSQLRAIAEVYASEDAKEKLARDFAAAWAKVMDLDRFDFAPSLREGSEGVARR